MTTIAATATPMTGRPCRAQADAERRRAVPAPRPAKTKKIARSPSGQAWVEAPGGLGRGRTHNN